MNTVATYVFWQAHEPVEGFFCWDGNRDLRAFVQLAAAHGLEVVVRLGPWAHGEARYGGFPDWLVQRSTREGFATRTNDPAYLKAVRAFYAQTVAQLRGLSHREGGPVVGAQVDNELYDQPQHLATLREIAEDLGLRVPLWTATGWGGAQVPQTLLPLYSAYSEGFWEESTAEWPAFAATHFRYSTVRDDLSVGADLREALDGIVVDPGAVTLKDDEALPFATCELGGGMHVAYHRRPLVTADDVAALALDKIGSGSIWQGYYMYAGGTQRTSPHGSEQESHATGYPNDVPTRSYDFYAPIGEHGQIRPHHHLLRLQHLWLHEDGPAIAAMSSTVGGGSEDPTELRWAVRSDGTRGYLFTTTYQPAAQALPAQHEVQFSVRFADDSEAVEGGGTEVTVPSSGPITLPAGVSVAWPLRYPLSEDLVLRSATARLLTRVRDEDTDVVVLLATPGIAVEIVLEGTVSITGDGTARPVEGTTVVDLTRAPGPDTVISISPSDPASAPGRVADDDRPRAQPDAQPGVQPGVRLMVLDEDTAARLYKLPLAGRDRLVLSSAPLHAADGDLILHTEESSSDLAVLPAVTAMTSPQAKLTRTAGTFGSESTASQSISTATSTATSPAASPWQAWTLQADVAGPLCLLADITPPTGPAPAVRRGGPMNRLSAPSDFSGAARLHLDIPEAAFTDADRVLLRVDWTGDVGRAVIDGDVVSDHFWHGRVWDIDLTAHRGTVTTRGLDLELLPWRAANGVWVDPSVCEVSDGVHVRSVRLVPSYRIDVAVDS
ncbi:hypothetical protein FHR75_004001 [Kineococcus radiotolerans]|uniref:Glycoside hydrolase 35 catalytic domain-containing protein n=1 Tax=Kineococcus radiotolerans TaxID=131568 RepID=A0A7W4TQG7_KINRA|nr:hypothetical protein [Kineococcus radiotolerans]